MVLTCIGMPMHMSGGLLGEEALVAFAAGRLGRGTLRFVGGERELFHGHGLAPAQGLAARRRPAAPARDLGHAQRHGLVHRGFDRRAQAAAVVLQLLRLQPISSTCAG